MRIKKLSNLLIVFLILPYLFCGSAHAKGVKAKHRHPQSKNYYLLKNVEYANTDGESLKLDLYRPTIMGGRLPVIIQIHGGGFRGGDKSPCPMIGPFIKNGYAVASLNYRLRDKGTFPNSVCDVKSAVRWLRANADKYNLAINRFGAIGGSAGGYLVAMLGTTGNIKDFDKGENLEYPCNVQAVVDLYGIGDFSTLAQDRIDIGVTLDGDINAQADYFGCESFANCPDLTKASPISYVSGDTPPFLIIHCSGDSCVPVRQSESLFNILKDKGIEAELIVVPGNDHAVQLSAEHINKIIIFFNKHLRAFSRK